jgi:transcriptional regulator with XRE-family HTH domain
MRKITDEIIKILEKEQKKNGMSAIIIAQKTGCTNRSISYWKHGKRNISLQMVEKILETLGYEFCIFKKEEKNDEKEEK